MANSIIDRIVNGNNTRLSDEAAKKLASSIVDVTNNLEAAKLNRSTTSVISNNSTPKSPYSSMTDTEIYTNLSEMINGSTNDPAGFSTILESLYQKNKKYYTIIKDYEIMPILIPQINRVLMFLINECITPDIQNSKCFDIKFLGEDDPHRVQADINQIKHDMKLDNMLRDVYNNRFKLGPEYYSVVDYNTTFDRMKQIIGQKGMNESTSAMRDTEYLDHRMGNFTAAINETSITINVPIVVPDDAKSEKCSIQMENVTVSLDSLNIIVERTAAVQQLKDAQTELLSEAYSAYKSSTVMDMILNNQSLNEAVVDTTKLSLLVDNIKKKKLQRCNIVRMDPAKMFKLKVGGHIIGYLYITDITNETQNVVNFSQVLKDQLIKSRVSNINTSMQNAEDVISKELATQIINKFDPNLGINRVEDIDLLHDFVLNSELYRGNKRITFYYDDEIYDLSRSDGSILTNAVFFTKLYSTLMLNNIMTKVLRGRGRQIHTVRMGASTNVRRYIENAMASLTMPEANLGTLHGSFEQMLNPFNAASDIIIPTEDDSDRYITTDYIPGQDIDMNDDFLRFMLNSIISSFGLDSAVIDATNGNLQFARTLTMESLQIANMIRNEQQDLHDSWENMCLEILRILGTEETQKAIDEKRIKVTFFEPKSLILQNTIDEINNAKTYAEALADCTPEFNVEGQEHLREKFINKVIRDKTNIDWSVIDRLVKDSRIDAVDDELEAKIVKIMQQYIENVQTKQYGDANEDGIVTPEDKEAADEANADPGEDLEGEGEPNYEDAELAEGEELMNSGEDEELDDEDEDL